MAVVSFQKIVHSGDPESKRLFQVKAGEIDIETYNVPQDKILIKAEAWALNPIDWKAAVHNLGEPFSRAGSDVSGTVVKVGADIENIKVGDDVAAFVPGNLLAEPKGEGAFSGYVLADADTTFDFGKGGLKTAADSNGSIPSGPIKSFEGAASVPLGIVTNSVVFNNQFEFGEESKLNSEGQTVVIWGGATSTGIIAIQLAKFVYKMNVIAVASSKHHEFLESIGATWTYDYKTSGVVESIKSEHKNIKYGFDIISSKETLQNVYDIVDNDSIIVNLLGLDSSAIKTTSGKKVDVRSALAFTVFGQEVTFGGQTIKAPEGVRIDFEDFRKNKLTEGFLKNHLIHAPLKVINDNHSFLKSVEEGLDLLRENKVSGEKVIVRASDVEN